MALYRRILLPGPLCDGPLHKDPCDKGDKADKGDKGDKGDGHLLSVLIIAVPIIVSVFFLCLTYYYAVHRRRWSRRLPFLPTAGVPAGDGAASPPSDDDGSSEDGEGLHHVWYIRTAGLDEPTIKSIGIVEYKAAGGLLGATDCSVCLGEFEDGDLVRLLPKCGHGFHVHCIDTWLRAHVNCPVCRAHIIDPPVELAGAAAPHPPAATTAGTISVDDSSSLAPVDNPETGIQALENDIGVQDVEEEIRGRENGAGVGILIDQLSESSELRVLSDLGEDGLQPVRRSVSMDSPFLGILPIGEELEENAAEEGKDPNFGEEQRSKNSRKQGNSSKRVSLKKGGSAIERSLSSSGWGFSRYGRVAKNSIPPM